MGTSPPEIRFTSLIFTRITITANVERTFIPINGTNFPILSPTRIWIGIPV